MKINRQFEKQGPLYLPRYDVDTPGERLKRYRRRLFRAAFVQAANTPGSGSSANSVASTFGSNIGTGNLVVGVVYWSTIGGVTLSNVADSNSSSYSILPAQAPAGGATFQTSGFWACPTGTSTGKVVTANFSGSINFRYLVCAEFSGINTTTSLDTNVGSGNGYVQAKGVTTTTYNSGNGTTGNANDLLIGLAGSGSGATWGAGTDGQGNNYAIPTNGSNIGVALEYISETLTNTYSASFSGNAADTWTSIMLAFQIAASPAFEDDSFKSNSQWPSDPNVSVWG